MEGLGNKKGVKIVSGGEMLLEKQGLGGKGNDVVVEPSRREKRFQLGRKMHGHAIRHLGYLCKQTSSLDPITTKKCHTLMFEGSLGRA